MSGSGCRDYRSSVGRRAVLGAGLGAGVGIGMGGLSVASDGVIDLSSVDRDTAVIQYWLNGAASHYETYDPKPDAPLGIRSPFHPIATNVPGTFLCESLPLHASLMDKVTLIRSVHHDNSDHQHGMHWCQTGHDAKANGINPFKKSSHASSGCLVSMVRGSNHPGMPPYVFMGYPLDNQGPHRMYPHRGAYLPARFNPMEILIKRTGDGKHPAQDKDFVVRSLSPAGGLSRKNFVQRRELLAQFEKIRGEADPVATASWSAFHDSAFDLVAGEKTGSAFDLEQEDEATRRRYGYHRSGQSALLARRLVERGVTFVTLIDPGVGLSSSGWDFHKTLEAHTKTASPPMDLAVTTLINDLHERGLDKKVLVVVWGEFGRTPKINKNGGRDHWADVQSVMMAGGNYRHGQVIGSSNAKGEVPHERPLWPYDVVATMYHHLGIDPSFTPITGATRTRPLLERGEVIRELL
ncbi:MAG: hypothetical protein CMJ69_04215 [Planctomycetaceae bacterium]|nr:hypothetical protein [Planctomycetaceae bacterium]|tara:strand:+ start:3964 stop:5358 length:1395 start_codon:yes stop_codon:yes gene_type:complete